MTGLDCSWIPHPAVQYALIALGLAGVTCLFYSLKLELAAHRRQFTAQVAALEEKIQSLSGAIEALKTSLRDQAPPPAPSELNWSRRARVLRMHRRGEPPATIAAALGVPRNEVDLLLKVHGMVVGQP